MRLSRIQWLVSLGPPLFVLVLVLSSWLPHTAGILGHAGEHLLLTIILLAGVVPFSIFMAFVIRASVRLQQRLLAQNEELEGLNATTASAGRKENQPGERRDGACHNCFHGSR